MNLIEQSWQWEIKPMDTLEAIEMAGRTCYKSFNKITSDSAERFVKMLLRSGHESVIEHISASVRFITNRGVTHELVRHRLASFCLSGNTILTAYRNCNSSARSQKSWTIEQLYNWQSDIKRKGRIKLIRLRSIDDEHRIVPGIIKNIIFSGNKYVYELKTLSGRSIHSTEKHRFLTQYGWKRLEDLSVGDRIYSNGISALKNKEWLYEKYIKENNTLQEMAIICGCCTSVITKALRMHGINKPLSMRKNRKPGRGKSGMFSEEMKKIISDRMKGDRNHRWLGNNIKANSGRLRSNKMYKPDICYGCGSGINVERHHLDKNPINNEKENIMFLCQKCHKAFHLGPGVLTVFLDEIISINPIGIDKTYDIEMEAPYHNFIANGIVVHNSQESTRYCNYSGKLQFIKPVWFDESGAYQRTEFLSSLEKAEEKYNRLIELGWRPEQAREVLPNALKTEIVMTANLREWRHVFKLRTSKQAHPQMRALMLDCLAGFKAEIPIIFDEL